jgi:hypothetical protein
MIFHISSMVGGVSCAPALAPNSNTARATSSLFRVIFLCFLKGSTEDARRLAKFVTNDNDSHLHFNDKLIWIKNPG